MPRTPKVVEDRREQIIDAAMRVFAQKGFARATNRDVAREAGITAGLIYYYFENKEALLKIVLEERSPIQIVTNMPPEMLEQPPEIFLPLLVTRALAIIESEQFLGIIRVMLSEVLYDPQVAAIPTSFIQRIIDFLGTYLRMQVSKGTVRTDFNAEIVAQLLVGSVIGFLLRRQVLQDLRALHYTHEEIAQTVVKTLLDGLRPR